MLGLPLPLYPPYDKMYFLAAGGSAKDRAEPEDPASDTVSLTRSSCGGWVSGVWHLVFWLLGVGWWAGQLQKAVADAACP